MSRIQGVRIGVAMVALVFALFTVNTLTAAAGLDMQLESGGLSRQTVDDTTAELSSPQAETVGQQDPGFFGVAVGTVRTFNQLWTITTNLHGVLISWGVHWTIAYSAQGMVDLTMAIAAFQILKSFKF